MERRFIISPPFALELLFKKLRKVLNPHYLWNPVDAVAFIVGVSFIVYLILEAVIKQP